MRVVVVGAGIVGLAAADALVRRDHHVTVLEAHRPMGARSAGSSRIVRLAHGDPALVEAAARARVLWDGWSARAGHPLVGGEGVVVSGLRAPAWADAMAAAGAPHTVGEPPSGLLGSTEGPVLVDPGGGAVDLAGAGVMLQAALRAHLRPGRVVDLDEFADADAVVVAAGAGTAALVAPLGIEVPAALRHHVRCTFAVRAPRASAPPAHLDGTGGPDLASTYQHRTPEGHWAVGGAFPDEAEGATATADHDLEEVRRRSREALAAHVRARLPELDPTPIGDLACTPAVVDADGVHTARAGNVHVLWGGNLAKFAPLLGEDLADAVEHDDVAHAIGEGATGPDHGR